MVLRADRSAIVYDDDPARVDLDVVWTYLSTEAYWWHPSRTRAMVERQVREAWRVVAAYEADTGRMVGFARAVSDGLGPVLLADVFVVTECKGSRVGTGLIEVMIEDGPGRDLAWLLHTADAHRFYERFGFEPPGPRTLERPARRASS